MHTYAKAIPHQMNCVFLCCNNKERIQEQEITLVLVS